MELCGYGIDGIDYIIRVPIIEKSGIFRKIEFLFIGNFAIRGDFFKSKAGRFDFIHSDCFVSRQNLAVYVGFVHGIAVD